MSEEYKQNKIIKVICAGVIGLFVAFVLMFIFWFITPQIINHLITFPTFTIFMFLTVIYAVNHYYTHQQLTKKLSELEENIHKA